MQQFHIDGADYEVEIVRRVSQSFEAARLVVVSYLPNETALKLLQSCVRAIRHFTTIPYELWIIDNNSPHQFSEKLLTLPDVNVVFNRTTPTPVHKHHFFLRLRNVLKHRGRPNQWGSYANAIALEIAARCIDNQSQTMMTLHMDTMPCRKGWLLFLHSKLQANIAAVGVRLDRARTPEGILHVLGYLVDFQLFRQLKLDFLPQLPQYDVGDRVTVVLRKAGYDVWACPNTLWEPELVKKIPSSSPLRDLHVDRSFDDEGNVIFLHLGRGIVKSVSGQIPTGRTSPQQWVEFADRVLLSDLNHANS